MEDYKVGDYMEILDADKVVGFFTTGRAYEIIEISGGTPYVRDDGNRIVGILSNEIKFTKKTDKPSKRELIKYLQNELASLKGNFSILLDLVEYQGREIESLKTRLINNETLLKKNENSRKEVIKKAKEFVDKHSSSYIVFEINGNIVYAKKIESYLGSFYVKDSAHAVCREDDVFNIHIGKAIALGKLLYLDIAEFENAPQPTTYAEGQLIVVKNGEVDVTVEVTDVGRDIIYFKKEYSNYELDLNHVDYRPRIIDDSHAKY